MSAHFQKYIIPAFYLPAITGGHYEGLSKYELKALHKFIGDRRLTGGDFMIFDDIVEYHNVHSLTPYGIPAASCVDVYFKNKY